MGKKNFQTTAGRKKAMIIGFVIIVLLGVAGVYYMVQKSSYDSQNASAGLLDGIKLEGFTLKLERVVNPTANSYRKDDIKVQWKYTVSGAVPACYTADFTVNNGDKEPEAELAVVAEDDLLNNISASTAIEEDGQTVWRESVPESNEEIKRTTYFSVKLSETPGCKEPRSGALVKPVVLDKQGTLTAYDNTPFKFVVAYKSPAKNLSNNMKLTSAKGFTVISGYTAGASRWNYSVSGNRTNCYTVSTWPAVTRSSKGTEFNGRYYVRLTQKATQPKGCENQEKAVSLSRKVSKSAAKGVKANVEVRYVYNGVLVASNNPVPTVRTPKTIVKDGFTFSYYYIGNQKWGYKVTGNLPNACQTAVVSNTITRSMFETINVTLKSSYNAKIDAGKCPKKATPFKTSGTINGNSKARFNFTVLLAK
ncbi:hypothetical protein HYV12_00295 [Candidatus Dojkabacteria bacterium]|nr:hypothetical protein [Candidatus Dojkabacteria bacterium]